jgi:hypothetical protein
MSFEPSSATGSRIASNQRQRIVIPVGRPSFSGERIILFASLAPEQDIYTLSFQNWLLNGVFVL